MTRSSPALEVDQPVEPARHRATLVGDSGHPGERLGGVEGAGGRECGRDVPRSCGPEGETGPELADGWGGLVSGEQRPGGVTGADQAVGRAGGDAGQQARPPGGQNLLPRLFLEPAAVVVGPVADPAEVAQRWRPGVVGDRLGGSWELVEPGQVRRDPGVDGLGESPTGQHLDGHRPVVGEVAAPFWAGDRSVRRPPREPRSCGRLLDLVGAGLPAAGGDPDPVPGVDGHDQGDQLCQGLGVEVPGGLLDDGSRDVVVV